jgi:hypothetical protein
VLQPDMQVADVLLGVTGVTLDVVVAVSAASAKRIGQCWEWVSWPD